jgi:hypothetical protein
LEAAHIAIDVAYRELVHLQLTKIVFCDIDSERRELIYFLWSDEINYWLYPFVLRDDNGLLFIVGLHIGERATIPHVDYLSFIVSVTDVIRLEGIL